MKYIAVVIVVVIIGILAGASLKGKKHEIAGLAEAPAVAETEAIASQAAQSATTSATANEKRTMEKEGVKIEVTKEGAGTPIANGQTAVVHYTGSLTTGAVFDSSKTRGKPFEFPLGAGMVIKGWEIGVEGMKVGETRMLTIPANLAYGAAGVPGAIPPNATLVFEVELLGVK